MGICISSVSSQIRHETKVASICPNDVVLEERQQEIHGSICGIQKLDSICSEQGGKGLNQDAAFFYQVIKFLPLP